MYYREWAERYDEFADVAAIAVELGLRVYVGPCYMSGITYVRRDRTLDQFWDEPRGLDGAGAGDTLLPRFRRRRQRPGARHARSGSHRDLHARAAGAHGGGGPELDVPVRLHCCQSVYEFATVLRLRQRHAARLAGRRSAC